MGMNIPISQMPRVVVIGGGFGGLSIIRNLKNVECQIVLIDKNNYHTFQPLLYQVSTGGLEPGSIAYPLRRFTKKYKNVFFRMADVLEIDSSENTVITSIGNIKFDYLIIATGSESNYFGNKEVEKNSMTLKTITQSLDIRSLVLQNFEKATLTTNLEEREALMNFVIAGGGPTGVELAGAFAELKNHVLAKDYPELDLRTMQIHLLEGSDRLLGVLTKETSEKTLLFLKKLGVNVWLNTKLENYDGKTAIINNQKTINTYTLIWTAGVKGTIIKGIPEEYITKGSRIKVNEYNLLEKSKNIFIIGDVACMATENYPNGHPMVAPVAIQQGKNVAKCIKNYLKGKEPKKFKYYDKGSMATIGRNKAVVEIGKLKFRGTTAWFVWTFVHLMSIVGFRNRLIIFMDWLWNYISYDRALRLIIRPFKR